MKIQKIIVELDAADDGALFNQVIEQMRKDVAGCTISSAEVPAETKELMRNGSQEAVASDDGANEGSVRSNDDRNGQEAVVSSNGTNIRNPSSREAKDVQQKSLLKQEEKSVQQKKSVETGEEKVSYPVASNTGANEDTSDHISMIEYAGYPIRKAIKDLGPCRICQRQIEKSEMYRDPPGMPEKRAHRHCVLNAAEDGTRVF